MFEFLAIVLLIVLLIILLVLKSDVQTRLSILQTRIDQLTAELKRQRELPAKPAEEKKVANKGTLFLDEIGNLSMPLQAKRLPCCRTAKRAAWVRTRTPRSTSA